MLIHLALQDGFDGDEVAVSVDDREAYRAEGVTTRTQISHAADMQLEVPDRPFVLGVDVTTREVRETFDIDHTLTRTSRFPCAKGGLSRGFPSRSGSCREEAPARDSGRCGTRHL